MPTLTWFPWCKHERRVIDKKRSLQSYWRSSLALCLGIQVARLPTRKKGSHFLNFVSVFIHVTSWPRFTCEYRAVLCSMTVTSTDATGLLMVYLHFISAWFYLREWSTSLLRVLCTLYCHSIYIFLWFSWSCLLIHYLFYMSWSYIRYFIFLF